MDTKNYTLEGIDDPLLIRKNDDTTTTVPYDRALELAGNGKFQIIAMISIGLSIMVMNSEIISMAFILPSAKCDLHLSTTEQGFIYAVSYIGIILTSYFWGFLADTWGRRKVLIFALCCTFLASFASAFSTAGWMLMVTRFLCGLSLAAYKGTGMAYFGELLSDKIRPAYLSYLSSIMSAISLVQPLIGMAILTQSFQWSLFGWFALQPWRVFMIVNTSVPGLALLALYMMPESPKFLLATNRSDEARKVLCRIYSMNKGEPIETYPVENIAELKLTGTNLNDVNGVGETFSVFWQQTKPLFMPPYLGDMLFLGVVSFLLMFVVHGQMLWLPQLLSVYMNNNSDGLPVTICEAIAMGSHSANGTVVSSTQQQAYCDSSLEPLIFYTVIGMGLSFTVVNSLIGMGVGRFGKNKMIMLWLSTSVSAGLAIIWATSIYFIAALLIVYISASACFYLIVGVFADLFPTHLRVMALNLNMMISRLGSVAGSNFMAALIYRHCNTLYLIDFIVILFSVICIYRILRKCDRAGGI